jgi:hypothetical protein
VKGEVQEMKENIHNLTMTTTTPLVSLIGAKIFGEN